MGFCTLENYECNNRMGMMQCVLIYLERIKCVKGKSSDISFIIHPVKVFGQSVSVFCLHTPPQRTVIKIKQFKYDCSVDFEL